MDKAKKLVDSFLNTAEGYFHIKTIIEDGVKQNRDIFGPMSDRPERWAYKDVRDITKDDLNLIIKEAKKAVDTELFKAIPSVALNAALQMTIHTLHNGSFQSKIDSNKYRILYSVLANMYNKGKGVKSHSKVGVETNKTENLIMNFGGNMFKNVKEARNFTAHLDALANEIEGLAEVSPEMKKHLAYRLDRLSDLIEASASSMEKQANGVGQGAWMQDEDEKYMQTMGGTGALKQDKDEPYMDEFKGDDHMEVLKRKENMDIAGDGKKVKQPSDDYNEKAVASRIKTMVKDMLKKQDK